MNTLPKPAVGGRRRRRVHSDEFKARAVAASLHPGVSMAAVAMSHGINANLLRRWVHEAEVGPTGSARKALPAAKLTAPAAAEVFVPMQLPGRGQAPAADIRIELRRGATAVSVSWPSAAAGECAAWMRELLR